MPVSPTEKRYCEFRADGNTLIGTAIRYGDVASIGGIQEKFEPGAFGDLSSADILLTLQHDRSKPVCRTGSGLSLIDTQDSLQIRAILNPEIASKTLALVKSKILRGLSIEFRPVQERIENNVRVIERAILS